MTQVNTQTVIGPGGVTVVPPFAKYLIDGFQPVPFDQVRMVLMGLPKTGKSTLADSAPGNLTIDFSRESRGVVTLQSKPLDLAEMATDSKLSMYAALEQVIDWLVANGPARTGYRRVTFDTGGRFYQAICEQVVFEYNEERKEKIAKGQAKAARHIGEVGAEGAGWNTAAFRVGGMLSLLANAGYGWTFIAHEKLVRDDENKLTLTEIGVPNSLRAVLFQEAELIVSVERAVRIVALTRSENITLPTGKVVSREVSDGTRSELDITLRITPTFAADPKGSRYSNMPREMKIPRIGGWAMLGKAYEEANAKTRAEMPPK